MGKKINLFIGFASVLSLTVQNMPNADKMSAIKQPTPPQTLVLKETPKVQEPFLSPQENSVE